MRPTKQEHFDIVKKIMKDNPNWDEDEIVQIIVEDFAFKFTVDFVIWAKEHNKDFNNVEMSPDKLNNIFTLVENFQASGNFDDWYKEIEKEIDEINEVE